jgi:hypothetical protein
MLTQHFFSGNEAFILKCISYKGLLKGIQQGFIMGVGVKKGEFFTLFSG